MLFVGRMLTVAITFALLGTHAHAVVINVPNDHLTIQEAINAAALTGDIIEVEPGTYTGPLNRDLDFLGKAIVLRGLGGAGGTIIDCQQISRAFNFHSGETNAAVVERFTIMNGRRPGDQIGGGILCVNASSPTFRDCVITLNEASNGSGMHCDGSSPVVSNCTFVQNGLGGVTIGRGAGINCINNSNPSITACAFTENLVFIGDGAGISCNASSPTVTGCTFTENSTEQGAGMSILFGSSPVISDCIFDRNFAENGGDALYGLQSTFGATGCLFVENGAFTTVVAVDSHVTLTSCTIALSDSFIGGSVAVDVTDTGMPGPAIATLDRVIVAFTDGIAVSCSGGGQATLTCCDVFGNAGGDWTGCIAGQFGINGNFSLDPQFCDLDNRNFRLQASSPCLPGNHPQGDPCGLIGVYGSGCATAVEPTTWGAIKAHYGR